MTGGLLGTLAICLVIQAIFFAFAATLRTDKVTDLSYGLTFVILALLLLRQGDADAPAQLALAMMVALWGFRLAGYLLFRIIHMGRDKRFDGVRERFWRFFRFWFFQGVAVWVIMLPVILWFGAPGPWTPLKTVGTIVWAIGLAVEAIADAQKFAVKRRPGGESRWMETGLWRYSRHPNYFGELLVWWGIFVFVAGDLTAPQWLTIVGPITITFLLLRVTGIPTLEASAAKKWGGDPAYQAYVRRTNRLVPWPTAREGGPR